MNARRIRYAVGSLLLPARRLWNRTVGRPAAGAFRILTFHHVPKADFAVLQALIDYLMEQHFVLTPEEAQRLSSSEDDGQLPDRLPSSRQSYLLTFDDGFRSNFEVARSILATRSITAVFFVCPAMIDAASDAQRDLIVRCVLDGPHRPIPESDLVLMGWEEVRSLRADGHAIGSHTASHRRLSTMSGNELVQEIVGSAARLREKLGEPISWFAYPFGKVESMSREAYAVVQQTFRLCCTAVRGINDSGSPLALLREDIELEAPLRYQKFVCEGGLDFYYASRRRQLRSMLPPQAGNAQISTLT